MDRISGFVESIIFRNETNGYTVLEVTCEGGGKVLVGQMPYVDEGEFIEASGHWSAHAIYGDQLLVESYQQKPPEDSVSIERYLASGAIRGVGPALAGRIVKKFGEDSFRIIEEEPERLVEVKGISESMALKLAARASEKRDLRQAMMYLQKYGISVNLAVKIYEQYGDAVYSIIKENPYKLADDITGVGFKIADDIAMKAGILVESDFRIKSGILYTLLQAAGNGHTYLPLCELEESTKALLGIDIDSLDHNLTDLMMERKIIIKVVEDVKMIYASTYYYLELNTAKMLHDLNVYIDLSDTEIEYTLHKIKGTNGIELDEKQREAVEGAARNGLFVMTGGPGTGKTTTITTMIHFFESMGLRVMLGAPTGRAAKRMTEATGYEARTLHRVLEVNGLHSDPTVDAQFMRNEENPLDTDVLIVDEMSMVDIHLMHALLKAVTVGTRLILVGDVNQLPSVGAGNILKDLIDSNCFFVVKLTRIFRQASTSDIIINAHKINEGQDVDDKVKSNDFLFIRRNDANAIINAMITLVKEKLPGYVKASPYDIQVLTPMKKGMLGVANLNKVLQAYINPKSEGKREKEFAQVTLREGDKVMQIKNNYQLEWEVRSCYGIPIDKGLGVFNGDIGTVKTINTFSEELTVEYDEQRCVNYTFKQVEELDLAYAITIHKSQGSEYPAVVLPLLSGPKLLMTRNLLYTAVTRAKHCVCVTGSVDTFHEMIHNTREQTRYSGLDLRLKEFEV